LAIVIVDADITGDSRVDHLLSKCHWVVGIADDIVLFAAQRLDNIPNANAARPYARLHRLHLWIRTADRNFRAITGIPRNVVNLHRTIRNLSHFKLQ
jgi:hypothetical protein